MEMADSIVITKSDGENVKFAEKAKSQYKNALHLFPPSKSGWVPKVLTCSAIYNTGIKDVADLITEYNDFVKANNYFYENRKNQAKYWMYETINNQIKDKFYNNQKIKQNLNLLEKKVLSGDISGFMAAKDLLDTYFGNK